MGAEVESDRGTHFRVWAPLRRQVNVELIAGPGSPATIPLQRESDRESADEGYHSAFCAAASTGTIYQFALDDDSQRYPDPASRYQPDGPHGPSQVVESARLPLDRHRWRGATIHGQVIYEMHLGTFSREGTWQGAQRELAELARVGITMIEVMPIADFPGRFGWGYDGVDLFAPTWLYGTPDDMRAFVNDGARAWASPSSSMSSTTTSVPTAII